MLRSCFCVVSKPPLSPLFIYPMPTLRRTSAGQVKLFCKGADIMILARLRPHDPKEGITRAHLVREGLGVAVERQRASHAHTWGERGWG